MARPKQILSTKNLVKIVDLLISDPTWSRVAKCVGASERVVMYWRNKCLKAKAAGDMSSIFWLEYRGQMGWWTDLVANSRRENLIIAEAKLRSQSQDGIEELVFDSTMHPVWKENPKYVGRSLDFIRNAEGLGDWEPDEDVEWYRYLHDAEGNVQQLTRVVQVPVPLRKALLVASHSDYKESISVDVAHSGSVVHVQTPLQRLASEPRADIAELRRIAALSPEARRLEFNGSAFPKDARGLVVHADTGAGRVLDERSDHIREQQPVAPPPNPRAYYEAPLNPPQGAPRPSYAKPNKSLDQAGYGRGVPPPGGGPADGKGNVR